MNYHVTGSIRLAHSTRADAGIRARLRHGPLSGHGRRDDGPRRRSRTRYPFLETHDLAGGALRSVRRRHRPGAADPGAGQGRARLGAPDRCASRPRPACAATDGEWIVQTGKGDIRCEFVVNAAGYYAQRVGEWFKPHGGRDVPMMVMSHQYMLTDEIPELEHWSARPATQAAAAARRRQLLLPAAGEERPEPRPLRAQLQGALGHARRSDARGFQLPALSRRSGAAGMVHRGRDGAGAAAGPRRASAR